jgi:hypothetical protein
MQRVHETGGADHATQAETPADDADAAGDLTEAEERELEARIQSVERGNCIDEETFFTWLQKMESSPAEPERDGEDAVDVTPDVDVTPEEDALMAQAWRQIQEGRLLTEEELWTSLAADG